MASFEFHETMAGSFRLQGDTRGMKGSNGLRPEAIAEKPARFDV